MTPQEAAAAAAEALGERFEGEEGAVETKIEGVLDPYLRVPRERLVEAMTFLRDDDRFAFDLLHCLSAVDHPKDERFELVYHLDSTTKNQVLTVRVDLPRSDPVCPTLENVWRTADWHEREAWDLMGIRFEGHHNLVRILCAEDWEGHPLRKDYEMPSHYHGIPNDFEMFYDVQNK